MRNIFFPHYLSGEPYKHEIHQPNIHRSGAVEISLLQQIKHKVYYKKARKRLNNKFVINVFLDEYLYLNINEYRNRIQKSKF